MKLNNLRYLALAIFVCMLVNGISIVSPQAAEEYSFKVHNTTDSRIKKVLVSEDKKTWGQFDIGSGIKEGATVSLVWAEHTNEGLCTQYVKAVFADGSESDPAKFDFCEADLELEF